MISTLHCDLKMNKKTNDHDLKFVYIIFFYNKLVCYLKYKSYIYQEQTTLACYLKFKSYIYKEQTTLVCHLIFKEMLVVLFVSLSLKDKPGLYLPHSLCLCFSYILVITTAPRCSPRNSTP